MIRSRSIAAPYVSAGGIASGSFIRSNGSTLEGRTKSQTRADLSMLINIQAEGCVAGDTGAAAANKTIIDTILAAGYSLEIPLGVFHTTGGHSLATEGQAVVGQNLGSVLSITHATNSLLSASAAYCRMSGFALKTTAVRSGGWYVDVGAGAHRFMLDHFYFDGAQEFVRIASGLGSARFHKGFMLNGVAATGILFRINGGSDILIEGITSDQTSQLYAGVLVSSCNDVVVDNCNLIHCGNAVHLNPGSGQVVASFKTRGGFFDNSTRGLLVDPGNGGSVVRCAFTDMWGSSGASQGTYVTTTGSGAVDGLEFTNPQWFLNGSNGFEINAGANVENVQINGGASAQNTGADISIPNSYTGGLRVMGHRAGDTHGLTATAIGLSVGTGVQNASFIGNDFRGHATANVSNGSPTEATVIFAGNAGYVTAGKGTGSIASGATTAVITHGLAVTPVAADIAIVFTEQGSNDYGRVWISTITSTQFTVNVSADPGASNLDFSWSARCLQ